MYISDEVLGALLSVVDGVELVVTLASIAEVLHCSMDTTNVEQFPVFTRELTVPTLVTEFYEGRQDDDNCTSICRSNLPRCLLFVDVVLKKNVIPLGYKEEQRGDFLRVLHRFDFGFWIDIPLRNTRGGFTRALPFANLITALIKGQGTYPLDPMRFSFRRQRFMVKPNGAKPLFACRLHYSSMPWPILMMFW
ncbi:hypothetical protein CsSME_00008758 [Camellia sinensis var. sinensis]